LFRPVEEINPFFFEPPLAPYHAIKLNGGDIDIGKCIAVFDVLRQKHDLMIVEGAGGIMVPIMETQEGIYSFLDLFSDLASDIIIVASRDLGTINHSWLTAKVCVEAGLNVKDSCFKGSGNYKPFMAYSKGLWRSGIKCKGFYF